MEQLGNQIPIRLRIMHSHWLFSSVSGPDVLLFRSPSYRDKSTSFMLLLSQGACLKVPSHLQFNNPPELLQLALHGKLVERLVLSSEECASNVLLNVLCKFEKRTVSLMSTRTRP